MYIRELSAYIIENEGVFYFENVNLNYYYAILIDVAWAIA